MNATTRRKQLVLLLVMVCSLAQAALPAAASPASERDAVDRVNSERRSRGLTPLRVDAELSSIARAHSGRMADRDLLHHNPRLATEVPAWRRISENVGVGSSISTIHSGLMASPGHRANILDTNVSELGVGVVSRGRRVWVTQVFRSPVAGASAGFRDVPASSPHASDIQVLARSGVTRGCGPGRFCPDDAVTREQMATFIVRSLDLPPAGPREPHFRDVSGPHAADVRALAAAGITRGCNPPANDRFCPTQRVSRQEMATFLVRAYELPPRGTGPMFTDIRGGHARDVSTLASHGITRGCNPPRNDRFCATASVTRAEMATFLTRAARS